MRKGARSDSERSVILSDPRQKKTLNFKCHEHICAPFLAKLIEEDVLMTDFFLACVEAYLSSDTNIDQALADFYRGNKRRKAGYTPHAPGGQDKRLKKRYQSTLREEKKLSPIDPLRAEELYDVIEKKGT